MIPGACAPPARDGFGVGLDYLRHAYGNDAPFEGAGYYLATVSLDFG